MSSPRHTAPSPVSEVPAHPVMTALQAVAKAREMIDDTRHRLDTIDAELRESVRELATALGLLGGETPPA